MIGTKLSNINRSIYVKSPVVSPDGIINTSEYITKIDNPKPTIIC